MTTRIGKSEDPMGVGPFMERIMESKVGYTPGPWHARGKQVRYHLPGFFTSERLADCDREANARLIAAAPELLAELRIALSLLESIRGDGYAGEFTPQLDYILQGDKSGESAARAAIAKAIGRGR